MLRLMGAVDDDTPAASLQRTTFVGLDRRTQGCCQARFCQLSSCHPRIEVRDYVPALSVEDRDCAVGLKSHPEPSVSLEAVRAIP